MVLPSNTLSRARVLSVALLALTSVNGGLQISEDRDLKEIDLTAWNCVNRPEGSGKSPETAERNRLKNRFAADLSKVAVTSFDTSGFLKHVADFDDQRQTPKGFERG